MTERWHAEWCWPGGGPVLADVDLVVDRGMLVEVGPAPPGTAADHHLAGVTIPGLVSAHSHAFQRVLRGRAQGPGDFWSWRDTMYSVAATIDPAGLRELALACFTEMALAGVVAVGEFHYLHHRPDGSPYDDPNAMGLALADAARDAGLRLVLLDACYLRTGFDGAPLAPAQRRFSDGDARRWVARVDALADALAGDELVTVGAAAHSVRAVDEGSLAVVADWSRERGRPLHVHVSEQPAENEACLAATGLTPVAVLARVGALARSTTLVHAIHLTAGDTKVVGAVRASVCRCPTTERDLGDGVGSAMATVDAGAGLCLGSDSQAVIDLFEEARAVELDQRLTLGRRGVHPPEALLAAATVGGRRSLGLPGGPLVPGAPADFVTVSLDSPRLAGADPRDAVTPLVFAASAADVTDVVVAGRAVVRGGKHQRVADPAAQLRRAVAVAGGG